MNSVSCFEEDISLKDPYEIFKKWLDISKKACKSAFVANSFCLTTVDEEGLPSGRLVTLTGSEEHQGFYFLTNSSSRKGQHMSKNPQVSLSFYWPNTYRMVLIDGLAQPGSPEMADEFFNKRPVKHKVWAHICEQGNTIHNMQILTDLEKFLTKKFGDNVPRPPTWEIYFVKPKSFQFFLSQKNLKHDKVVFRKPEPDETINEEITHQGKHGWVFERVFP